MAVLQGRLQFRGKLDPQKKQIVRYTSPQIFFFLKVVCWLDRLPPSWNITDMANAIIWANRSYLNNQNVKLVNKHYCKGNRAKSWGNSWHFNILKMLKLERIKLTLIAVFHWSISALERGCWTTQEEESGEVFLLQKLCQVLPVHLEILWLIHHYRWVLWHHSAVEAHRKPIYIRKHVLQNLLLP